MTNKTFLILGHAEHGKTTVGATMAKLMGIDCADSSWTAFQLIKPQLRQHFPEIVLDKDLYATKYQHRTLWKNLISDLCEEDPTTLARHILNLCPMYVGMRSLREFEASAHLFDHIFYVDATGAARTGKLLAFDDPSMEIDKQVAIDKGAIVFDNSQDLSELQLEAYCKGFLFSCGIEV